MILWGAFVDSLLIVFGSLLGRLLKKIPERMKDTVMFMIGIAIFVLGVQMAIECDNFIVVLISLVVGTAIGEAVGIDDALNRFGEWMEKKAGGKFSNKNSSSFAQGFITGTLIFVVGSMSILGALDSGLRHDHTVLITKGIIDGFIAIILSSTMGIGVLFAAGSTFIYEGLIAICAGLISSFIPQDALDLFLKQLTATGGMMIIAIGLNMLGIIKIRVANVLPAIPVVAVVVAIMYVAS